MIALSAISFGEFWPRYLQAHRLPGTRLLHYFATVLGIMSALDAILVQQPLVFVGGIAASYGMAIFAHWFVAGNQPLIKVSAFWGAIADMRMCWLALTGGLDRELERHGILVTDDWPGWTRAPLTQQLYRLLLLAGSSVGLAVVLSDVNDLMVAPHTLIFPVIQLGVPIAAFMMALMASLATLPQMRFDVGWLDRGPGPGYMARRSHARQSSLLRACVALLVIGVSIFAAVELIEREMTAVQASAGTLTSAL